MFGDRVLYNNVISNSGLIGSRVQLNKLIQTGSNVTAAPYNATIYGIRTSVACNLDSEAVNRFHRGNPIARARPGSAAAAAFSGAGRPHHPAGGSDRLRGRRADDVGVGH